MTVIISPKQYSVNVLENLYSDLAQVENETPTAVEGDDQINDLIASGQEYSSNAVVELRIALYQDKVPPWL